MTLFLLLTASASAQVITDINLWIGEDGFTWVEERFLLEDEGENAHLTLPAFADDIVVMDEHGRLAYNVTAENGVKDVKVELREYLEEGQTLELQANYGTHHLTKKEEGVWSFSYYAPASPRRTIVRVTYPVGAQVLTLHPSELLRTYVENGVWLYPQEETFNFTSTYQYGGFKPDVTTTTVPGREGMLVLDAGAIYVLALAVLLLAAGAGAYVLYRRTASAPGNGSSMTVEVAEDVISEPNVVEGGVSYDMAGSNDLSSRNIKESVLKMLDDKELEIVKMLENSEEDEVTQAYIHKTTGIPKASLSDILKRIEKRNIIERRVEGRVKWIRLKSWVLE